MNFELNVNPETFAVEIWVTPIGDKKNESPNIYQPFNPGPLGEAWKSLEEATAWANAWIEDAKNPKPVLPPEETPAE